MVDLAIVGGSAILGLLLALLFALVPLMIAHALFQVANSLQVLAKIQSGGHEVMVTEATWTGIKKTPVTTYAAVLAAGFVLVLALALAEGFL